MPEKCAMCMQTSREAKLICYLCHKKHCIECTSLISVASRKFWVCKGCQYKATCVVIEMRLESIEVVAKN